MESLFVALPCPFLSLPFLGSGISMNLGGGSYSLVPSNESASTHTHQCPLLPPNLTRTTVSSLVPGKHT
ncbi:hypothetical protein I79_017055 [Cricetulus griseus]|uniref:Uncharacterized protein n=1 Tax=Cricetulus griseus TaxID=10029 RepID=G3I112_CRIGR|nr:hypothetical protein I79_017055 [Cricetulus griseus]